MSCKLPFFLDLVCTEPCPIITEVIIDMTSAREVSVVSSEGDGSLEWGAAQSMQSQETSVNTQLSVSQDRSQLPKFLDPPIQQGPSFKYMSLCRGTSYPTTAITPFAV